MITGVYYLLDNGTYDNHNLSHLAWIEEQSKAGDDGRMTLMANGQEKEATDNQRNTKGSRSDVSNCEVAFCPQHIVFRGNGNG